MKVYVKKSEISSMGLFRLVPCLLQACLVTSMTSLLTHTVAQPTKWTLLPKNLIYLVIFVIELVFT